MPYKTTSTSTRFASMTSEADGCEELSRDGLEVGTGKGSGRAPQGAGREDEGTSHEGSRFAHCPRPSYSIGHSNVSPSTSHVALLPPLPHRFYELSQTPTLPNKLECTLARIDSRRGTFRRADCCPKSKFQAFQTQDNVVPDRPRLYIAVRGVNWTA
ncbi:hypothetical protein NMY22_g6993 [Coprinellus aureogranulatus]|nr:hypothetical protein NMY22_g6993 [Coprinellus aureogranulatus]